MVVRFSPPCGVPATRANGRLDVRLILRPTIPHPDLTGPSGNPDENAGIRLALGRDTGKPVDILDIDGSVTPEQTAHLEETIWQQLAGAQPIPADQFGAYQYGGEMRHSDPLALTQLLLTFHLLREYSTGTGRLFAPAVAAMSRLQTTA
jgi:phosphoribulokinase